MCKKVYVNIDGASRGNPGRAAIGIVVKDCNYNILVKHSEYIGKATNNVAEYTALERGLTLASRYSKNIIIRSDSKLLVNQLNGVYKIKSKSLKEKAGSINNIIRNNRLDIIYEHIRREDNKEADRLANKAIDDFSV